jgi:predicted HicB family RNase H-like nuclease
VLEYKGYTGRVEFDDEARLFHGEVIGLRDVVTFQGTSVDELEEAFQDSIEDYLEFCEERGQQPDKPFSGRFLVRTLPALHRKIYTRARAEGKSLNQWISDVLESAVQDKVPTQSAEPYISHFDYSTEGFTSHIEGVTQSNFKTSWGNLPSDRLYRLDKELDDTLTSFEKDLEKELGVPHNEINDYRLGYTFMLLTALAAYGEGTQDKDSKSVVHTWVYRMLDESVRERAGGRKED